MEKVFVVAIVAAALAGWSGWNTYWDYRTKIETAVANEKTKQELVTVLDSSTKSLAAATEIMQAGATHRRQAPAYTPAPGFACIQYEEEK